MNFYECRWQIPVKPDDKGNARDSGYSAPHSARISHGGEQRRNDSHESYLQGDRAHSNGVEHATCRGNIGGRDKSPYTPPPPKIHGSKKNTPPHHPLRHTPPSPPLSFAPAPHKSHTHET